MGWRQTGRGICGKAWNIDSSDLVRRSAIGYIYPMTLPEETVTASAPDNLDDDLNEALPAPQCRIDDPDCESCQ